VELNQHPLIVSAETAVRVQIVGDAKGKEKPTDNERTMAFNNL
jgi:hypothetical protein